MLWLKALFFNKYATLLRIILGRPSTRVISGLPYLLQGHVRYVLLNGTHGDRLTIVSNYKLDSFNLHKALCDDPFWFVRCKAIEKNDIPEGLWRSLAQDPNTSVRLDLLEKKECPSDILRKLWREDPAEIVRKRAKVRFLKSSSVMEAITNG